MNFFIKGVFFSLLVQAVAVLQKAYQFENMNIDNSNASSYFSFASSKFKIVSEFSLCGSIFINSMNSDQVFFQTLYDNNTPWFNLYITQQKETSTQHMFLIINGAATAPAKVEIKFVGWNHACIGKRSILSKFSSFFSKFIYGTFSNLYAKLPLISPTKVNST